jgi:protein ImuB
VLVVRCPAWSPDETTGPAARAFEPVLSAVREFCPRIEVLRPGICAFGAAGPAAYFGGEAELARKVADAITGLGFECGVSVACSMFAALLASRDAHDNAQAKASANAQAGAQAGQPAVMVVPPGTTAAFLAPRSVTVLGQPELASLLIRLGIRMLGEFAALPAAEVATRFGPQGLQAHRLARGLDPRPLVTDPPPADLSVQVEFDPPVRQAEPIVFAAKALAGQMHAKLTASGLGCVRVQVQVSFDDGSQAARFWRHDGLLSDLAVAERVRWQLDGWRAGPSAGAATEADEVGGVVALRLIPDQLTRALGRQLGLWGDAVVSDRVARAAIRVQAMLGHDAVLQPTIVGGRGPVDQVLLVPFGDTPQPARPADRPWPGRIPPPAPATVYPAPLQARVTDDSGSPVTVTGRGEVSADPARLSVDGGQPRAVTAWTGPWPVTERWWDPVHACRKARFQLVTIDGRAWLAFVHEGRWLIEASYD